MFFFIIHHNIDTYTNLKYIGWVVVKENLKGVFTRLLYGTTNKAKLASMRRISQELGVEIIGLDDLSQGEKSGCLPEIDETGNDPLENARIKADVYYKAFGIPVFSCDSGLYFDELSASEQPGTHVRRVGGLVLSDDEMIAYYSDLARKHGGHLTGRYRNAICFIADDTHVFCRMDESLEIQPFHLVSRPHPKRVDGFPLDALSVDIASGEYFQDLPDNLAVDKNVVEQGFTAFFRDALERLRLDKQFLPILCK